MLDLIVVAAIQSICVFFFYIYSCQEAAVLFLSALGLDWCYYIALSTSSHYYSNYIHISRYFHSRMGTIQIVLPT